MTGLILVAALSVTGASVRLDEDPAFQRARAAFDQMQLEPALEQLKTLSERPGLSPADRAHALVWLGLTEAELGDFAAAATTFQRALALDQDVALPPDASPKVIAMFRALRSRLPAAEAEAAAPSPEPRDPPPAQVVAFPWLTLTGGVTLALGAGVAGSGGVFGLQALSARNEAAARIDAVGARAALDRAEGDAGLANLLYGIGGALAGLGVVVLGVGLIVEAP